MFDIHKLPTLKFFCQEVSLPSLDLPPVQFENPLVNAPVPGEKPNFGEVNVTFMIDEDMANYIAIHNWMIGLSFPKNHAQYRQFIADQNDGGLDYTELIAGYSDGTLSILNSSNAPNKTIRFVDLFPTSLQQIQMMSTTNDTVYIVGSAAFAYTYYQFE